jgi:hydroxyacylglutathione hydrolase
MTDRSRWRSIRSGTSTGYWPWPAPAGVRITHVFETHLHNDYVTGGLALARLTGAACHFTHVSYVLQAAGQPHAVFSGGSLLYGSTGRPDLLGRAHAGELARAQHASARRLAAELPGETDVYPTHGFGSARSLTCRCRLVGLAIRTLAPT